MPRISIKQRPSKQWLRLEISWLIQHQFIERDVIKQGEISWPDGRHLTYEACYLEDEKWVQLDYEFKDQNQDWITQEVLVHIDLKPSNLGTGEIPFFLCPATGKHCRILYHGHQFPGWKCRKAYSKRAITGQEALEPNLERYNVQYWKLKRSPEFLELESKYQQPNVKTTYNGQKTHWVLQYERMKKEIAQLDKMRWIERKADMRKMEVLM